MPQTRASGRKAAREVLRRWADGLDAHSVLPNPHIPGVLNQPTYLVVPVLGRRVAIYVSWLPKRRRLWPYVLGAIEDLFEIKTIAGSSTAVGLMILYDTDSKPLESLEEDMRLLLERSFDFFRILGASEIVQETRGTLDDISKMFYEAQARREYLELWESERRVMAQNLEDFDKRTAKSLLVEGPYAGRPLAEARDDLARRLQAELGLDATIRKNVRVFNIKQWFLGGSTAYYFDFDFEIVNGDGRIIVQLTRGCASRQYRRDLRSLAAQARLIRYQVDPQGKLQPRALDYRTWLVVTGHLRGPEHDEMRYVRAMMAAGWHVNRADLVTAKKLHRGP